MTIRHASLLLPCSRLDDLPTHLTGDEAAGLLAAWTALWHPALIEATGALPGWHPADNPPDPSAMHGELVLIPTVSRQRLPNDWCDRFRQTAPDNPPPVEAVATRAETLAAALQAAALEPHRTSPEVVADFLALGNAHLQVELLTRAMHYSSVLDTEQFTAATVAAARAAVAGDEQTAHAEIARAFDLLSTARNHVYSVDFYLVDLTLLAPSTLGDALRKKLADGSPTNLLLTGELIEQMARERPNSLADLRRALAAGTASPVGGLRRSSPPAFSSPERLLAELEAGQQSARRHLEREFEVYAQFGSAFSSRLPEVLEGTGFRGALHAAFDGGRLPRPPQCKTWWGAEGSAVQALAATPLDIARPETWLRLAERIGDTIAQDHVATILLAGWPGAACEYYDDLRRAARFGPLLGKLVTLEEYFRVTREPDEWTTFFPSEYSSKLAIAGSNPISSRVDDYCHDVFHTHEVLSKGLAASVGVPISAETPTKSGTHLAINAWSFPRSQRLESDVLAPAGSLGSSQVSSHRLLSNVPGCGYASVAAESPAPSVPLAVGRTIRNERFELTISEATGGIQSLRTHRDRSTRVSQRLVYFDRSVDGPTQMLADRIEITRNDSIIGAITSQGRLLSAAGELLAQFSQTVSLALFAPAVLVDVKLDPQRPPSGDAWSSYFASRMAWADEALSFRRGRQWAGEPIERQRIETPEWVEVDDGLGTITCYGLGLPFHRQAGPTWLDSLLLVAGETRHGFQFALGIDDAYPTQTALAQLTADRTFIAELPKPLNAPTGWFLHLAARNLLITCIEPLAPPQSGLRVRILETCGRDTLSTLAAFRPFRKARITDFRGQPTGVLSMAEGRAEFHIGPNRWIQIEAEW